MTRPLLPLALLLVGCEDVPHAWSRNDIEDIAADQAPDTHALEVRIGTLERRLALLEDIQGSQREILIGLSDLNAKQYEHTTNNIDRLFENDGLWRQHFNYLRYFHGAPPLPEPTKD
jgi:hypothetical protein